MAEDQYHNKQWGVEDFKRYHSQQMTNAERHALEKAALDDPFLEDALDGYAFASTPVEDIAALKIKLAPKKEETKVVALAPRRSNWFLKIAAILLLFAGLTWLLYPVTKELSTELATVTTSPAEVTPLTDSSVELPTGTAKEQVLTANEIVTDDKALAATKPVLPVAAEPTSPKSTPTENEVRNIDLAAKNVEEKEMMRRQEKTAQPSVAQAKDDAGVAANVIQGRVVDNQGAPIPYATVTVPQNNTNTATDANGVFFLQNNQQSNVLANVNAPGFETTNAPLNAGTNNNKIVLQESHESLSEVVVSGYGTRKRSAVTSATTKINADALQRVTLGNVRSAGNTKSFTDSLINLSNTLIKTDTTGYVLLQFDVDAKGKAANIVVSKSLCSNCDHAAVKLLQNVPALKRTNRNKPEARISF